MVNAMSHKKRKNRYDALIENLVEQFSKIENFQIMQEDAKGKELFNFTARRISEIYSFKALFIQHYIPAALRSAQADQFELNKSKYKSMVSVSRADFMENYYETIRLAYVGMFHKYENYIEELIEKANFLIHDLSDNNESIEDYSKRIFNFKIKDWSTSRSIKRLNWISICNKHYDGYPRKKGKPAEYENHPEDQKLKLTKDNFSNDIDILIKFYSLMLQTAFNITIHKMAFDGKLLETPINPNDDLRKQLKTSLSNIDIGIKKLDVEVKFLQFIQTLQYL